MFAVIFEVQPRDERWQEYLDLAGLLRPELIKIDGFVDNVRYRSLTRAGWLLSLSGWRDEKALVRWRIHAGHHLVQQQGREQVLRDYHLRVGQITTDTHVPKGMVLEEQRLDETTMANGTALLLADGTQPKTWIKEQTPEQIAAWFGLDLSARGLLNWDVFQGVLSSIDLILLSSWCDAAAANSRQASLTSLEAIRTRSVRVIRDYGKYQRVEAPQFYPEAEPN